MATSIYLGNPPPKIKEWIEKNYVKPEVDMTKVPLHFTANNPGEGATIRMTCYGYENSYDDPDYIDSWCELVFSTDNMKSWNDLIINETEINLDDCENNTVYIQAKYGKNSENPNLNGFSRRTGDITHGFGINGSVKADGNIQFLLENTGTMMEVPDFCYANFFEYNRSLTQAPLLPATTLAEKCYHMMFTGCSALSQAPLLPATTLALNCYSEMFYGCSFPFTISDKTFNEVKNLIENHNIFSEPDFPLEIICSDKTMIASLNTDNYEWTISEK